jgi:hypothetical protein
LLAHFELRYGEGAKILGFYKLEELKEATLSFNVWNI